MSSELQAALPREVPAPIGNYRAVMLAGPVGFVSGQFPIREGALAFRGRVGAELTLEEGREAARIAALNALGQVRAALGEAFPRVRLARLDGYVASAPGFTDQAAVLDGASDLLVRLLGERGAHARGAFAVTHLPRDAALELMLVFSLDPA
jgi:enamine deaminase RidA (YjgF/YER057c/UK114 family)